MVIIIRGDVRIIFGRLNSRLKMMVVVMFSIGGSFIV